MFTFPWAGGMNSCQFAKLDINLDGLKDLVVFDRTGDRILPFLTVQSGDSYNYEYVPEYTEQFPLLSHWAIFADYDGDGKEDIFTYAGYGAMKVYRNTSVNNLEFTIEVFPFLTSFQGGGYVNIYVTYADYPAICDLDGDGDLDILTFWGLGSFVEKHRNMSMEKYGHADSLDYMKTEFCWGFFAESEESNQLSLDTCLRCDNVGSRHLYIPNSAVILSEAKDLPAILDITAEAKDLPANRDLYRHTGSTFQMLDLNSDGLLDLLLGDVDYPNLIALYNGGNIDTARIVSYDWQFPAVGQPVNLFSMPAAFYDDFDFDGKKDLLVSPFDPNPFLTGNFQSVWFYHNDGNNAQPQFNLKTMSFLQDRMIDVGAGAYPVFFDIDMDGLTDLLIGNYGYYDTSYYDEFMTLYTDLTGKIAYLKNTGTTGYPAFTFIERDFAGASSLGMKGLVPAFGDLDGDGDPDMLLGCESGQVIFYLNTANSGEPMNLELNQLNYQGIDVGAFSTPQLFDLDRDDLPDLIIGEKEGNLNYYHNTGTLQKPAFTWVTDSLGKVNVTDNSISLDGYSVPFFYRDALDRTHLLVGSEKGDVFYYTGIDDNPGGEFIRSDTLAGVLGIQEFKADRGYRSALALFDLDDDGYPELIAGNFSGGVEYFSRNNYSPVSRIDISYLTDSFALKVFPIPAHELINISCSNCFKIQLADIFLYDHQGRLIFQYSGSFSENFAINTESFPTGIYILRMILSIKKETPGAVHCMKIIVF